MADDQYQSPLIDPESRKTMEAWLKDNINQAEWIDNPKYDGLIEFVLEDRILAWIQKRPSYCDRGHWQGQIEFSPGNPFDAADGGIHYYMRLEVAKQELREKLLWRACKIRVE